MDLCEKSFSKIPLAWYFVPGDSGAIPAFHPKLVTLSTLYNVIVDMKKILYSQ